MGKVACIIAETGSGKTSSLVVNPDGKCIYLPEDHKMHAKEYLGMDPKTHFHLNLDRKAMPFPEPLWSEEYKNYAETENIADIKGIFEFVASNPDIKSIGVDTINIFLAYKEFNERNNQTFDKWRNVANDLVHINKLALHTLRPDQICYIFGHVELREDAYGKDIASFALIGQKSKKQVPEGFYDTVLLGRCMSDTKGNNKYVFQTRSANSTAKTPMGMFKEFEIPNSLKLVDTTLRSYFRI